MSAAAMETLSDLNARVNRLVRYTPDATDRWQTPEETLERGAGDCEDIAILKFSETPGARLTYCKRHGEAHMVAEVDGMVLDNLIDSVLPWTERDDLSPLFSFDLTRFWVRGELIDVDPQQRLGQWGRCVVRSTRWLG